MSIYFKIIAGLLVISALLLATSMPAYADEIGTIQSILVIKIDIDKADGLAAKDVGVERLRMYGNRAADRRVAASKKANATVANHSASEAADWTNDVFVVIEANDGLYDDTTVVPASSSN